MAEEPRLFLRSALFGIAIGVIYWLVTREVAGTVLLGAFGLASMYLAGMLFGRWRGTGGRLDWQPRRLIGLETLDGEPRLIPEPTRFPGPSLAPLLAGVGLALVALGLPWGPGFFVVAIPFLLLAASSWYRAAVAEFPGGTTRPPTLEAILPDDEGSVSSTSVTAESQGAGSGTPSSAVVSPESASPAAVSSRRSLVYVLLAMVVVAGVLSAPRREQPTAGDPPRHPRAS